MSIPSIRRMALAAFAAALIAVPATVVSAPAAGAAPYPPGTGPLVLSSTTVSAGGSLTFSGSGFTSNEAVGVRLAADLRSAPSLPDPTLLTVVRADSSGTASGTVNIPRRVPSGSYSFSLAGSASGQYLSAIITVIGRPGGPGGGPGGPGHPGHHGFPGFLDFLDSPDFPFSGRPRQAMADSAPVNVDTEPVVNHVEQPENGPDRTLAVTGAAAVLAAFGGGAYLMRRRQRRRG
ncbi:hypothetical protein [Streptomyces sp. NBC_01262]|uniref:hypothetical protein n=1 Tax=Streptomyces sp. NBC_01262 TaxID=2903803 RepID=UPI002E31D308|nr:hypothetical protein [Streptomyces sp. NBC_01262]